MTTSFITRAKRNLSAKKAKKDQGIGLVELLVAVGISGALATVAAANMLPMLDRGLVGAANESAAQLMLACEAGLAIGSDLTTDAGVIQVVASLPQDPKASVAEVITAGACTATVSGTAVATDGTFTAFGAKTPAVAS